MTRASRLPKHLGGPDLVPCPACWRPPAGIAGTAPGVPLLLLAALRSAPDCARRSKSVRAVGLVGFFAAADWIRAFASWVIGVFFAMPSMVRPTGLRTEPATHKEPSGRAGGPCSSNERQIDDGKSHYMFDGQNVPVRCGPFSDDVEFV